ncbi:M24 family metallopeptidase [Novosphingobium sp.]|uniref:M24 family metallopeptidase n=1 Tax=Novosphingobium sp. TaxID=1874826 RepID=UPI003BAA7926
MTEPRRVTDRLRAYVPQVPLSERDLRWARVRKLMATQDIDAVLFFGNDIYWGMGMANLRYMFQVDSQIGAHALLLPDGDPVIWNAPPHMSRPTNMYLALQDWVSDFRPALGPAAMVHEIVSRAPGARRIGYVGFSNAVQPSSVLAADLNAMTAGLPNATFVDLTQAMQAMRLVKSEVEIDLLRQASKISRLTVDAMVHACGQPGATEASVFAEMIRTQIANGAEPNIFNLMASGPVDHPEDEIWHLLHGCEQPLAPTMRPLDAGDIMIAEWHTKFGGYRCHSEYTVYLGKTPPDPLKRIWDVTLECFDASKSALVAGHTIREAYEMIERPAIRAGLQWVELGFHAMGTASPEFPTVVYPLPIMESFFPGIGDFVLEEGMCFGNNIDLHDPAWRTDVGCMYSDFMVVRPGAAECLVGMPREMGSAF